MIQFRRGPLAQWLSANPVLAEGEAGYITDTKETRIGDGVTAFSDLPPLPSDAAATEALETIESGRLSEPQLSATFATLRPGFAPQIDAPLLSTVPVTIAAQTVSVIGYNPSSGLFYGTNSSNGHYATSTDLVTWTDRTYSPSTYTPSTVGWEFDTTYMYAYSSLGRIWRAPLNTFNSWTEITVAAKGPLTTGRPGSLAALGSGVLVYGNYTSGSGDGAHIWRSTNAGASWTEVLGISGGKHVHAIRLNSTTGNVWASLGDAGFDGIGLWKSADNGATWTHMSDNEYGIDMAFIPAGGQFPAMVVLEGDGANRPHLVAFPEDGAPGDVTFPLVWFTGAPSDPYSTRATVRGIGVTPGGHIVYHTTTEGGGVGTRAGIYISQAPDFTRALLLYDTTDAEPVGYGRTYSTATWAQNLTRRFATPTFGSY
jgi:hypothetical protein